MSYDLRLYRKDETKSPLKRKEFQKLNEKFEITLDKVGDKDQVLGFRLKYKNDQPEWLDDEGFEVYFQEDGYYWTYISYSATDEMFDYFQRLINDLSSMLELKIQDTQISNEIINPNTTTSPEDGKNRFNLTKKVMVKVVNSGILDLAAVLVAPAKSKFFVMYFLTATDPVSARSVLLSFPNNKLYASKVSVGETLKSVIDREIVMLTGSSKYKVLKIVEGGTDLDRNGNEVKRLNLHIDIPYFNINSRKLKYPSVWSEIENL